MLTQEKTRQNNEKSQKEVKPANPISTLQNLLEKSKSIYLDAKEAKATAEKLAEAFPLIKHSKERLEKFIEYLTRVLKYANIANSLIKKKFDAKELSKLFKRKDSDLEAINRQLEDAAKRKTSKLSTKEQELANKKVKKDDFTKNMFDTLTSRASAKTAVSSSPEKGSGNLINLAQKSKKATDQFRESLMKGVRDDKSRKSRNSQDMNIERNDEKDYSDEERRYQDTMASNLSLEEQRAAKQKKKTSQHERDTGITRESQVPLSSRAVLRVKYCCFIHY